MKSKAVSIVAAAALTLIASAATAQTTKRSFARTASTPGSAGLSGVPGLPGNLGSGGSGFPGLPSMPGLPGNPGQTQTGGFDFSKLLQGQGVDLGNLQNLLGGVGVNQISQLDLTKIMANIDVNKIKQQAEACAAEAMPAEDELAANIETCVAKVNPNSANHAAVIEAAAQCAQASIPDPQELVAGVQKCVEDLIKTVDISKFLKK